MFDFPDKIKLDRLRERFDRNYRVSRLFSEYLTSYPALIDAEMMSALECQPEEEAAVIGAILSGALTPEDTPEDLRIQRDYILPAVRVLDISRYRENPYFRNIRIPDVSVGNFSLKNEIYPAYRAFVCGDMTVREDFLEYPPLGYFREDFTFPAVLEGGNEWMTLTPVDVDTCEDAIAAAHGRVVTFGLGLGYYAYRVSEKEDVGSVTVVEISPEAAELFEQVILPQFPHKEKVNVTVSDAFEYAQTQMPAEKFDYAFVDTWRDAGDGLPMYRRMKRLEQLSPNTGFSYWIEGFILSRARSLAFEDIWQRLGGGAGIEEAVTHGLPLPENYSELCRIISDDGLRRTIASQ